MTRKISITETQEGFIVHATGEPSTGAGFSKCEDAMWHLERFVNRFWKEVQYAVYMPNVDGDEDEEEMVEVTSITDCGLPVHNSRAKPLRFATHDDAELALLGISKEERGNCRVLVTREFSDKKLVKVDMDAYLPVSAN